MIIEKVASIPNGIRNVTAVTLKVRSSFFFSFVSHFRLCFIHKNKIPVYNDVTVFVFSKCFFNFCQITITDTTVADVVNQTASLLLKTNTVTPKAVVKVTGILDEMRNVTTVTPEVRSTLSQFFVSHLLFFSFMHVAKTCKKFKRIFFSKAPFPGNFLQLIYTLCCLLPLKG